MADCLKTLLMDQLADLHDSVVAGWDEHSPQNVLGEELDQLRSTGTGKSLVMLALLDDLLRMTEIVLAGQWNPLEPGFAEFAAPFFQSAAQTFAKKGLNQYAPFRELSRATAGRFLEHHAGSGRPFGGLHAATQWSGLTICANAADTHGNLAAVNGYERLSQTLLTGLVKRVPQADFDEVQQLVDFITDRCSDVRDRLQARNPDAQAMAKERAELSALRAELTALETRLAEREQLIQQEWKRFQQQRAEFEQLRQQWEERLADQMDPAEEFERLANQRETLAIERAALNNQRLQLEADRAEWERNRPGPPIDSDALLELHKDQARLLADRQALEEDRAALKQEREELTALREQWQAEQNLLPEEDHVLLGEDSLDHKSEEDAAVMTADDANDLLIAAVLAGDAAGLQAALNWGADANYVTADQKWQTPLHLAARKGHAEIVCALLEAGADAERTDAESFNPLVSAIIEEQPETARILATRCPESIAPAYPMLLRILRDAKSPPMTAQALRGSDGEPQNSREGFDSHALEFVGIGIARAGTSRRRGFGEDRSCCDRGSGNSVSVLHFGWTFDERGGDRSSMDRQFVSGPRRLAPPSGRFSVGGKRLRSRHKFRFHRPTPIAAKPIGPVGYLHLKNLTQPGRCNP